MISQNKIKIVLLTDCLADLMGGAERQIYELAKGLDKNKFDVTIASLECVGQAPRHLIEEIDCRFIAFRVKRIYGLSGIIQGIRFWKFLKKEKVKVLQTYHFSSDIWGVFLGHFAGVKMIIANRRDMGFWRNHKHVAAYKWVNKWVNKIVVVSASIKDLVIREENVAEYKIQVIYNGVHLNQKIKGEDPKQIRQSVGLLNKDVVIMHVANLTPVKSHEYLIAAFAKLQDMHQNLKLVLIGEGPQRGLLENQIRELKLNRNVILLGKRQDVQQLLRVADICVLSSTSEGMSNAILEYMAAGKPVVATSVGGNPELVKENKTGYLVAVKDAYGLYETLSDLINNPSKQKEFGRQGLIRIQEQFTMGAMVTAYQNLYEKFLLEKYSKVLHLVSSNGMFGAERVILNLAQSQDYHSYVAIVHNLHNPHLEMINVAKGLGFETAVFDSKGRIDLRTIFNIKQFLRDNNITIVHTHNYKSDILGFCATRNTRVKWIATNHVWHGLDSKLRLYEKIDAFILRFARHVIAVSSEIKDELCQKNIPKNKVSVIDNGIDIDQFKEIQSIEKIKKTLGLSKGDFVVSIVGRLSPEKGHKTFLEAARQVLKQKPDVKFLIVGEGPIEKEINDQAGQLRLNGQVIFTGVCKDMPAIYAASDILVNASSIEGLPMTILEAMAAKVALIVTPVGAVPKVIQHDHNGLIVKCGDSQGLAHQLCSLIDHPKKRQNLINQSYKDVCDKFSSRLMASRYRDIYASQASSLCN